MDKKELQKAQNIIDALFYDDKALTLWQHTLLENVISIAHTKLRQPDVSGRSEQLPPSDCSKCGASAHSKGKPFCTDEFCNRVAKAEQNLFRDQEASILGFKPK